MARHQELWMMGHNQNHQHLDLGLGWLYYGLARSLQPRLIVVIGSWRGFVPILMGQALQDAGSDGNLIFIDPSLVDSQWHSGVDKYFAEFGIHCIQHFAETSQQFLEADRLEPQSIDLLFIDGYHSYESCRFEFEEFTPFLSRNAVTMFHDSTCRKDSSIYGKDKRYTRSVWRYINDLRARPELEVLNLEIGQGIAIVKRKGQ